jgi:hypothetical protein
MKVSDLDLTLSPWVETKTDSHNVLSNEFQRNLFIRQFGDVAIVPDRIAGRYIVPEFSQARKEYSQSKLAHCQKYGSH